MVHIPKEVCNQFYESKLRIDQKDEGRSWIDITLLSPSEKFFYASADLALPSFKKLGMTPNKITILSFTIGILGSICLYKHIIPLFMVFLYVSYWLDCADGQFARRYGPYTKFGDKLDHITDWISFSVLSFVFIGNYGYKIEFLYLFICFLFFVLFCLNFVTMAKLDGKKFIFKPICNMFPIENRRKLLLIAKYLRHIDTAMLMHFVAFSVIIYEL
jgi:phosphatidylglycerophosphate synthase